MLNTKYTSQHIDNESFDETYGTKAAQNYVEESGTSVRQTGATRGSEVAASVQIVDASGNQITSFGGSSGLTDTELRATPVIVDLGANNDVTVTGTVTANLSATDNAVLDVIAGNTTSIDGKITACNTGAIAGTVTANLSATDNAVLDVIAGDTTSLDGKVTACNTEAVVISTNTDSIDGAGAPSVDSYTTDDVNLAADTANQSVIAAPGASKQIWVYGLVGTVDVAGSISIQDEDDTALSGVMPVAATGGFVMNPSGNFAMPWIKVATNKALEIDTVTCAFDGIITYSIVSV